MPWFRLHYTANDLQHFVEVYAPIDNLSVAKSKAIDSICMNSSPRIEATAITFDTVEKLQDEPTFDDEDE